MSRADKRNLPAYVAKGIIVAAVGEMPSDLSTASTAVHIRSGIMCSHGGER